MFCPDCGTQSDSNFCPGCGRNLQDIAVSKPAEKAIPPLKETYYYEANGKKIDLHRAIKLYGTGWRKSGAYGYLALELGITKKEAKAILDPVYAAHAGEKITFWTGLGTSFAMEAEEQRAVQQEKINKRLNRKKYIAELEKSGVAYCPKCLSTSVTGTKRGYSAGQALLTGNLLIGAVGANKTKCVCLKCGHTWKP